MSASGKLNSSWVVEAMTTSPRLRRLRTSPRLRRSKLAKRPNYLKKWREKPSVLIQLRKVTKVKALSSKETENCSPLSLTWTSKSTFWLSKTLRVWKRRASLRVCSTWVVLVSTVRTTSAKSLQLCLKTKLKCTARQPTSFSLKTWLAGRFPKRSV